MRGQAMGGVQEVSYYAATCLLRGHAFDALENHARALRCYRTALLADPLCYEAFQVCRLPCCRTTGADVPRCHVHESAQPRAGTRCIAPTAELGSLPSRGPGRLHAGVLGVE